MSTADSTPCNPADSAPAPIIDTPAVDLRYQPTERGFPFWGFTNRRGEACEVQKSSLATEDAIWFGLADANPVIMAKDARALGIRTEAKTGWVPYPIPKQVLLNTRMHLTREEVRDLIPVLQHFANAGELPTPQELAAERHRQAVVATARLARLQQEIEPLVAPATSKEQDDRHPMVANSWDFVTDGDAYDCGGIAADAGRPRAVAQDRDAVRLLGTLPDDACRSGILRWLRGFDGHAE